MTERKIYLPPVVELSALRQALGLTLEGVAREIERNTGRRYSVGTLSNVESGTRGMSQQLKEDMELVLRLSTARKPQQILTDYTPRLWGKAAA